MSASIARPTAREGTQLGIEVVPGTPVAATVRLIATSIKMTPKPALSTFAPVGAEVPTHVVRGKEFSEGEIEGLLSYTELPYLLASLLTNAGGLTYKPPMWTVPAVDTLTVENGSATNCERYDYVVVSGLRFRFTREEAALSGSVFGRECLEAHTLTAGLSPLTKAIVNPDKVEILIGDSVGGLAAVDQFEECELNIAERFGPRFPFDPDEASFGDVKLLAHQPTCSLGLPHGADAEGYITNLRNAATKFCRIRAVETIGGVGYSFQATFPFFFIDAPRADRDGVWGSTFEMGLMYDETFGGWLEVVIDNT